MSQEPGDGASIKAKAIAKYGLNFQLFAKVDVNGRNTHDVYKFLRSAELKNQTPAKNKIDW